MLRKIILFGAVASLASIPFWTSAPPAPVLTDAEIEASRTAKLCAAGLRPLRECQAPEVAAQARAQTAPKPRTEVSTWADPSSAEQAASEILARTTDAPGTLPEPQATGAISEKTPPTGAPETLARRSEAPGAPTPAGPAFVDDEAPPERGRQVAALPAEPPAGQVPARQVAALPAEPPAGQVPARQVAALPAEPPTGQVPARQVAALPTEPPAGQGPAWPSPGGRREGGPAEPAARTPDALPKEGADREAASRALAQAYLAAWSSSNGNEGRDVREFYADRVNYFGRMVDQQALADTKRRFADRWPVRNYRHRPGSLTVRCDESGAQCKVRSVVDYEASHPSRGTRARGALALELAVDASGPKPVVRAENTREIASAAAKPAPARPAAPRPVVSQVRSNPAPPREATRRIRRPQTVIEEVWIEEGDFFLE